MMTIGKRLLIAYRIITENLRCQWKNQKNFPPGPAFLHITEEMSAEDVL